MKTLNFEKESSGRWFVVLPQWEGDKADLEMVKGADMMLDILAQGEGEISLSISETFVPGYDLLKRAEVCDSTTGGAYYKVGNLNNISYDFRIWLCDVTKFIFGDFPEELYIKECSI